ncbi:Peroxisomal biogenesis factor [Lachnellula hyalina]|uniref:Peroxisomal ATPase PEX6 n=1 Tax=Lachnellula hyalina TaxID=1316788 RepID=A0A8H8R3H8_9HELO|nr:Peroxisomal biogenesis factor [Lachnellula hyalina]TVY27749.1 Peroxisomal biogenesis factor [Lachnellula hyalina]
MADSIQIPHHRKRKRRRQDKSSITARLVLDDHVKGDVGILSEDLFADLFPAQAYAQKDDSPPQNDEVHHVAISPWEPSTTVEDSTWTVVPIRSSSALAHSTVQFSPSSLALQGFAAALQKIAPSKLSSHSRSGIEIRILDVIPMPLDTVFVTIERELASRLENGEGTFHGEHARTNGKPMVKTSATSPEELLSSAIREALGSLKVVHTGDDFPLPLQPHPITHIPPPPAKVTLSEPVGQGILSPQTKIIITQSGHLPKTARKPQSLAVNRLQNGGSDDEDTSNDQFYSAAEDRYKTDTAVEDNDSATDTEADLSEEDNLSDDSMDDMISLQAPMLPAHNASGISTVQPGSPQTIGHRTNGIATPGSVFSSFTATTARAGGQKGRLFKAQGLMKPLAEEILHPKPSNEDDEESRVFVDVSSLSKIGCFSGDWVRLEVASEPPANGAGLWGLGSFGAEPEDPLWRPVKVFGLPEGYSHRPVTKIPSNKLGERRMSFFESQVQKPTNPIVYLSPVLLANMENTPYCRLSALKRASQPARTAQPKITSSSRPPFAQELTLSKIATPLSTDRNFQDALFANLKGHFANRIRVVRKGDLVAIPIDEDLGRTLYEPSASDEIQELLSNSALGTINSARQSKLSGVGWFKIVYIGVNKDEISDDEDIWGGAASIDSQITKMMQSGSATGRVPGTMDSTWKYYLGLTAVPKSETSTTSMPEAPRHQVTTLQRRLRELIAAATSPRAIHLQQQSLAILLVSTQRNIGKATLASKACADIGLHTYNIDAYDIMTEGRAGSDTNAIAYLETRADKAMACGPEFCSILIRHIEALTADRMITSLSGILSGLRVLIATTTEVDKIPDGVRGLFTHELEMSAPDEWEREGILRGIIDAQPIPLAPEVDLSGVAVKTAALVAGDLVDVVDRAVVGRNSRLESLASASSNAETPVTVRDVLVAGGPAGRCLTKADFDLAVDAARKNFADAIGAPKIPNVGWDDVGGLTNVKDAVIETIQLPLERPELFAKGMKKRSGILFYGPPGTGKTLLAKAIATEFSLNFFSVKGPELLNMYIGESEANVRRVFQRARDARPCVVFFDELDSVAPKRGNQGDSGGVMDRIVSQLLAELDGMSDGEDGGGGVFVIGATNRPDLLDAALLRPGRFDKMLYLGVSDTHEKQLTIMEALTRKFTLHPSLSLQRVASRLPFTYTGADFYALCSDAMLKAVTRQASLVDTKIAAINNTSTKISTAYFFDHYATKEDTDVVVTEEDFMLAEKELVPSVSFGELEHYKKVRGMFEKPDDGKGKAEVEVDADVRDANGRPKSKGKAKVVDRKGKGRAVDSDEGGITSNGSKGKGKGKAVDMGFRDGEDDDEGLY